jgi:hypothetical protein
MDMLEETQFNPKQDYLTSLYEETMLEEPFTFLHEEQKEDAYDVVCSRSDEGNSTNIGSCQSHSPKAVFNIFSVQPGECANNASKSHFTYAEDDEIIDMHYHSTRIGPLSIDERKAKLRRYTLKKQCRKRPKKQYVCRQVAASSRLRYKGRFIKNSLFANESSALHNYLSAKLSQRPTSFTTDSVSYNRDPIFLITKMPI